MREFFGAVLELEQKEQQEQEQQQEEKVAKIILFYGFQKLHSRVFWRGFGTSSSFRGMVFPCREVIFSELFYG